MTCINELFCIVHHGAFCYHHKFEIRKKSISLDTLMEDAAEEVLLRIVHYCDDDATALHNMAETSPRMQSKLCAWVHRLVYDNLETRPASRFPKLLKLKFQHQVPLTMTFPGLLTSLKMPNETFFVPPYLPNLQTFDILHNRRAELHKIDECTKADSLLRLLETYPHLTSLAACRPPSPKYTKNLLKLQVSVSTRGVWNIKSLREFSFDNEDDNTTHIPPNVDVIELPNVGFGNIELGDLFPEFSERAFKWSEFADVYSNWLSTLMDCFRRFTAYEFSFDKDKGILFASAGVYKYMIVDERIHTIAFTDCEEDGPFESLEITIPRHVRRVYPPAGITIVFGDKHLGVDFEEPVHLDGLLVVPPTTKTPWGWTTDENKSAETTPDKAISLICVYNTIAPFVYPKLLNVSVKISPTLIVAFLGALSSSCPRIKALSMVCGTLQYTALDNNVKLIFPETLECLTIHNFHCHESNFGAFPHKLVALTIDTLSTENGDAFVSRLPRGLAVLHLPGVVLRHPNFPPRLVTLTVATKFFINLLPPRIIHGNNDHIYLERTDGSYY